MKSTRLAVWVIALALIVAPAAFAAWVPFAGQATPGGEPQVRAPFSDRNETLVLADTPGMRVTEIIEGGTLFQRIELPGYKHLDEVGLPQIPTVRKFVAIPNDADVEIEVIAADYQPIEGDYTIWPVQPSTLETEAPAPFAIDAAFYETQEAYPAEAATVSEPMLWRNLRVVIVEFHPIRYLPSTGAVEVASAMAARVRFTGTNPHNSLPAPTTQISPLLRRSYSSSVVNLDHLRLGVQKQGTDAGIDYLILADPDLIGAVQPLADYHTSMGLNVSIVDVTTVGSAAADIRNYIVTEYESADPPDLDYVLFAADVDVIPLYNWDGNPSDSWYTLFEGDDWLQDIGLGRIPAKNATEMTTVVNKILDWHNGTYAGEWTGKASLIAHKEQYPGKYTQCSEEIRTATYDLEPPAFDTIYGGEDGSNQMVIDRAAEGRGILNYRGHGSATTWSSWDTSSSSFTTAMAGSVSTSGMTPIVYSIACLNMSLNSSSQSFAEAWFMQDDGAVAFLGATEPSYTYPNHDFDKYIFQSMFTKGIMPVAYVVADASNDLVLYGGHGSLATTNIKMYLWLGDPATPAPVNVLLSPAGLTAEPDGTDTIELSWTDRADSEDGYEIEVKYGGGDWEELVTTAADVESYTHDGLSEATRVSYRARAFETGEGESSYSNTAETATLPLAPTGAGAQVLSTNSIYLTWTDNSGGEDGYLVERGADDAKYAAVATLPADSVAYTDNDLTECTGYSYRISAFTLGGEAPADVVEAATMPATPTSLFARGLNASSVRLQWEDNSGGEDGYRIFRGEAGEEPAEVGQADANAIAIVDSGLDESTTYTYRVCAIGPDGDSAMSNDALATTAPARPSNLDAEGASDSAIRLTWTDNSDGEIGFRIYRDMDKTDPVQVGSTSTGITEFVHEGLEESTRATYFVIAFNNDAESDDSETATGMTLPAAPQNLLAVALSDSEVELDWVDASNGEEGYVVERKGSGDTFDEVVRLGAGETGYVDDGLTAGKTYTYRVYAYHDGGASGNSNESEVTTMGGSGDDDDDDDSSGGCAVSGTSDLSVLAVLAILMIPLALRRKTINL